MSYIYPALSNNKEIYKAYFVYKKHKIYLGQFLSYESAESALREAAEISNSSPGIPDFDKYKLSYKKIVIICNLRDNDKYFKNPIYLYPAFFHYYLPENCFLIFDLKDLLYFSTYKIYKRGQYLYTQDSISQKNILSRFGIPNHSVAGKDYIFLNGNSYDFRRDNLKVINQFKGVSKNDKDKYTATIFTDKNITIGHYDSELEAAIAYNKACDMLVSQHILDNPIQNNIEFITRSEHDAIYEKVDVSPKLANSNSEQKRVNFGKKYKGICKDNNSYRVHINYQGKQIYLGMYPTEKRAAQAYNYASLHLFGRKGFVNDVIPTIYEGDIQKITGFLEKYNLAKKKTRTSAST